MKFSGKTYDDIKSDSKTALLSLQALCFFKCILRVKVWIFFEWNFSISFLKLERASEKLVGKLLGKGYDASYVFWYLPNYVTYVKILAHVRRFYVDCRTLNLWKSPKNRCLFEKCQEIFPANCCSWKLVRFIEMLMLGLLFNSFFYYWANLIEFINSRCDDSIRGNRNLLILLNLL